MGLIYLYYIILSKNPKDNVYRVSEASEIFHWLRDIHHKCHHIPTIQSSSHKGYVQADGAHDAAHSCPRPLSPLWAPTAAFSDSAPDPLNPGLL